MLVYPAIDILAGKVVRLRQGRYDEATVYDDDPAEQARRWADGGAEWIHVVDLDGAASGLPVNLAWIARIVERVDVKVQVGGGVRTMDTLRTLIESGVSRVVLGTTLVTEPEFVAEACAAFGEGIVAGIDARDGKVAIRGWREGTSYGVLDLVRELVVLGVERLVYTDIAVDGTQEGISFGAYRALVGQVGIPVIASGGVGSLDDIRALASIGTSLEGVIVGRALYEAAFTVEEAVAAAKDASRQPGGGA